jgi:hypothetical protein
MAHEAPTDRGRLELPLSSPHRSSLLARSITDRNRIASTGADDPITIGVDQNDDRRIRQPPDWPVEPNQLRSKRARHPNEERLLVDRLPVIELLDPYGLMSRQVTRITAWGGRRGVMEDREQRSGRPEQMVRDCAMGCDHGACFPGKLVYRSGTSF